MQKKVKAIKAKVRDIAPRPRGQTENTNWDLRSYPMEETIGIEIRAQSEFGES